VADDSQKAAAASDVGSRYAQALFDLAREEKRVAAVEKDLKELKAMIAGSPDLRTLILSPKFKADAKGKGLAAVAAKAKFNDTTRKFLGLVAANGRANQLSGVIAAFEALAAAERGAISAQVTTAVPLSPAQAKGVAAALRQALGKDPEIETRVDPAILGGIRVKVGSRLYDASLKSKLDQLKFALKRA
jgi:F-type H+-transporting ATPase subunit delta